MSTETQREEIPPTALWLSLASGPLLWAAYHALVYAVSSLACQKGFWVTHLAGPFSVLTLVLLGITVLIVVVMGFSGYRAYNYWKTLRSDDNDIDSPAKTRPGFMAFSAVAFNLLFGIATLLTFLSSLFFDPCS